MVLSDHDERVLATVVKNGGDLRIGQMLKHLPDEAQIGRRKRAAGSVGNGKIRSRPTVGCPVAGDDLRDDVDAQIALQIVGKAGPDVKVAAPNVHDRSYVVDADQLPDVRDVGVDGVTP